MGVGVIDGGWGYVLSCYGIVWLSLLGYGLWTWRRIRAER